MTDDDPVADDGSDDAGEGRDRAGSEGRGLLEDQDAVLWAAAVVSGAVAYLLGYLVTLVAQILTSGNSVVERTLIDQFGRAGVIYSAAHRVDVLTGRRLVVVRAEGPTALGREFDFFRLVELLDAQTALPVVVYLVLPFVALATVSLGRAWYLSGTESPSTTVLTALGIPVGYGGAAYLGALVFSYPALQVRAVGDAAYTGTVGFIIRNATTGEITRETLVLSTDAFGVLLRAVGYSLVVGLLAAGVAVLVRDRL